MRDTIGLPRVLVLVGATALTIGLCVAGFRRMVDPNPHPTRTWIDEVTYARGDFADRCGREPSIVVEVVHSPEKQRWMSEGAKRFMRRCPNTQIRLDARPDPEALDAIEHQGLRPTMWSPSDELFLDGTTRELRVDQGPALVRTPMIVLTWTTRHDALTALWSTSDRDWPALDEDPRLLARLWCGGTDLDGVAALADPIAWSQWWPWALTDPPAHTITSDGMPSAEQLRSWGALDFHSNMPSRSTTGHIALLLLISAYLVDFGVDEARSAADFESLLDEHDADLHAWLARCEQARDGFTDTPRVLTQRFMQLGPDGFDGVLTYEHLALEAIEQFEPGTVSPDVRLVYPARPFVSNHPVAYFPATCAEHRRESRDSWLVDQRNDALYLYGHISERDCAARNTAILDAAERFVEFLREPEMQQFAIEMGFRPGDASIDLAEVRLSHNPFRTHRHHGVELRLDRPEYTRPGFEFMRASLQLWSDATGRH